MAPISNVTYIEDSPAKVNLYLKVQGKRQDGYHDIVSIFQPISLKDIITIEVTSSEGAAIEIKSKGIPVPTDSTNLVHKAALAFLKETAREDSLKITIDKKVPVAAGLGGGSSNAAAALTGLNTLLNGGLGEAELLRLALEIGSDVPFFILKSSALVSGRGEVLERVRLPKLYYLLINPGFAVTAKWAYDNLDLTKIHEDNKLPVSVDLARALTGELNDSPSALSKVLCNDLEDSVIDRYSELKPLKQSLLDAGASGVLLSGSGPTVFGVFTSKLIAEDAYNKLTKVVIAPSVIYIAEGL